MPAPTGSGVLACKGQRGALLPTALFRFLVQGLKLRPRPSSVCVSCPGWGPPWCRVGDVGHGRARASCRWRDPFSWVDFCALCSDHRAEVSPRQETRRAFVTFVTVDRRKAAAHSGGFRGPLRAVPVTCFYRIPHPLGILRLQNSTERSCTPLTLRRLCIYNSA